MVAGYQEAINDLERWLNNLKEIGQDWQVLDFELRKQEPNGIFLQEPNGIFFSLAENIWACALQTPVF